MSQLTRRERLILLVRWYPEAQSQGDQGGGSGGGDHRVLLPGELWWDLSGEKHRVWTELERCLVELKRAAPRRYEHMKARYWQAEKRRQPIMRSVKTRKGKNAVIALVKDGEPQYELREIWPKWVNVCHGTCHEQAHCCKVNSALLILDRCFRGDTSLPRPLAIAAGVVVEREKKPQAA